MYASHFDSLATYDHDCQLNLNTHFFVVSCTADNYIAMISYDKFIGSMTSEDLASLEVLKADRSLKGVKASIVNIDEYISIVGD
jgi:hypothetical protein